MKKLAVFGLGMCIMFAFASCKSSESAYKKAYEQAKQQELADNIPAEVTPVVTTPPVQVAPQPEPGVRQEKVTVVYGADGLKDYGVVCGSFTLKANAENLKDFLQAEGYTPTIAFNPELAMYRVIVSSYSDRGSAANARDAFKSRYPNRKDFQESWLLYRL